MSFRQLLDEDRRLVALLNKGLLNYKMLLAVLLQTSLGAAKTSQLVEQQF